MSKPNNVIRLIRDGRVKILGRIYTPAEHHRPYRGELDGQRWCFGVYWGPPNYDRYDARGIASFVSLWGTEAAARCRTEDEFKEHWPGPNCIDGYFQWEWWNVEGTHD